MATAVSIHQGAKFQMGKGDSRSLVNTGIGAQRISMNYSVFQPGQEFPQHFHDVSADIFIVLEGGVSVREGDRYTPIRAGSFAYIPPGEVHGTVNQTDAQAILISFQSPPDLVMYRGERDPAVTGSVPTPPPNHVSQVQIHELQSGAHTTLDGVEQWTPVLAGDRLREMRLAYYVLAPGASCAVPATTQAESIWFVREGNVAVMAAGETLTLAAREVAFLLPGEAPTLTNIGGQPAQLIRCQTLPE